MADIFEAAHQASIERESRLDERDGEFKPVVVQKRPSDETIAEHLIELNLTTELKERAKLQAWFVRHDLTIFYSNSQVYVLPENCDQADIHLLLKLMDAARIQLVECAKELEGIGFHAKWNKTLKYYILQDVQTEKDGL